MLLKPKENLVKKMFGAVVVLSLSASVLHAQVTAPNPAPAPVPAPSVAPAAAPDLSGTWKLNLEKSNYDQVPPPQDETIVITQKGPAFTIATTADNDRGKEVYTLPFTADGADTPTPKGTFADTATLQFVSSKGEWKGGALVLTQKILYENSPGTLTSTFKLSPDGKTLTRVMDISVDQGVFQTTSVYDKQ